MDKQLASLFHFFIEAMKDEFESYSHLLDCINEETQALRHSKLPGILTVGNRKSDAFRQTQVATQRRTEAVAKIMAHLDLESTVSFMQLAAYADIQTKQTLTEYRNKFSDIIHNIESANKINRQIIELTLTHVNNNIRFIQSITSPLPNYDQQGQIKIDNHHGGIVSQAG